MRRLPLEALGDPVCLTEMRATEPHLAHHLPQACARRCSAAHPVAWVPFSGAPGTPNGAAAGARGRLDVSDLRMPHRRRPWEAPRRRPATRIRQGLFILGTPVPQSGPWQQSRGESVSYVCFCALEGPELEPLEPKWLRWTDDAGVASFVLTAEVSARRSTYARTFVSSATATAFPCNIVLHSSQASIII